MTFTRMEWWDNRNENALGQAVVGFTEEGDTYLTFDIRGSKGQFTPVFSPMCKVGGGKDCHKREAYEFYRRQFLTLDGYDIYPIEDCSYSMKENPNIKIKFKKNG